MPLLGPLTSIVTPISLVGDVLTDTQRHFVGYATETVLGCGASIQIEMIEQAAGEPREPDRSDCPCGHELIATGLPAAHGAPRCSITTLLKPVS